MFHRDFFLRVLDQTSSTIEAMMEAHLERDYDTAGRRAGQLLTLLGPTATGASLQGPAEIWALGEELREIAGSLGSDPPAEARRLRRAAVRIAYHIARRHIVSATHFLDRGAYQEAAIHLYSSSSAGLVAIEQGGLFGERELLDIFREAQDVARFFLTTGLDREDPLLRPVALVRHVLDRLSLPSKDAPLLIRGD